LTRVRKAFVIVFFAVLFAVAGCQRQDEAERVIVRFTTWGSPASNAVYQDIVKVFEERNPDVKIELLMLPWSQYHRKIITMSAVGSKLDFMRLANSYFPQFVEKKALLPLDRYVERDQAEIRLDDFFPEALMGCMSGGRVYGLPLDIDGWGVYYNRGVFERAGLPFPDRSWTWETFVDVARKLTRDFDGDGIIDQYGAYIKVKMGVIELLAGQSGAVILNEDNSQCLFDTSEGRAVIQLLYDLIVTEKVVPPAEVRANQDVFTAEKAAMVLLRRGDVTGFRQSLAFDWDVGPVPMWPGREPRALIAGGSNPWVISSHTKLPEASWRFLKFFTGPEAVDRMTETGRFIPARRSVAESAVFLDTSPPEHNAYFLDLFRAPNKVFVPRFPRYRRLEKVFQGNFQFLMEGKLTVETCTAKIARDVDRLIEQVRAEEAEGKNEI